MKTCSLLLSTVALVIAVGCSKQEPPPPEPISELQRATTAATTDVNAAAADLQRQSAAAQEAASKATADLQAQAAATIAKASTNVNAQSATAQSKIDAARKFIAEKNWSEALRVLSEATALRLTPEQQATVDNLKQQVQKMMQDSAQTKVTDEAGKALGDLLKKK